MNNLTPDDGLETTEFDASPCVCATSTLPRNAPLCSSDITLQRAGPPSGGSVISPAGVGLPPRIQRSVTDPQTGEPK